MKKIFFVILAVALTATNALAASATFSWLPNSETDLAGYKIHYGPTCDQLDNFVDVGLPETKEGRVYGTVENIPDGKTCYAATAYDTGGGESGFSNTESHDAEPASPAGFAKTVIVNVNIN